MEFGFYRTNTETLSVRRCYFIRARKFTSVTAASFDGRKRQQKTLKSRSLQLNVHVSLVGKEHDTMRLETFGVRQELTGRSLYGTEPSHTATKRGENVLEAEKVTSSISRILSEMEPY